MGDKPRKIQLRVSNHKAYVWDIDDIAIIRAEHHLCGVLTGTLQHVSQQNVFLGAPLILLPEEVVLLVTKKFAVLVDDPKAHSQPSRAALEKWNNSRTSSIITQLNTDETSDSRDRFSNKVMSEEAIQKRKAREERRAAAARAQALAEGIEENASKESPLIPTTPAVEQRPATPSLNVSNYTVNVPANSAATLDWYNPDQVTYETIDLAQKASIWHYPSNLHERAKCGVFQDLWEKGHFMGVGIKFGGDFLVYPGDPLRYHSHFVSTVIDSPIAALHPMEIVAHGRLGTATKKAHLLCGWDDERQEASYLSIEWAGFG